MITDLRLRGVLDSRARPTVEVDLVLGTATGRGSCAVAIAPGRLERRRRLHTGELGDLTDGPAGRVLREALLGRAPGRPADLDALLRALDDQHGLGADVTLAVSLAYHRAAADRAGQPLHGWLAELAGTRPALPGLLVNAFSGGIHRSGETASFQQVMLVPGTGDLLADVRFALAAYEGLERAYPDAGLSASSGLLVTGLDTIGQLAAVRRVIATAAEPAGAPRAAVGVDVAAEHLTAGAGRYRFEGREYPSPAFAALLLDLAREYGIEYLEDPFDPADTAAWAALVPKARDAGIRVVGDDLFASDATRVRADLADAVLLKPSQAGTVTATLDAAAAARAAGLSLVVSHRSGETEDTAMCDLAVAVGAELIKIGGPRRGDRLAKYNQLLRLAETTASEGGRVCHVPSSSRS
jgi:enolase